MRRLGRRAIGEARGTRQASQAARPRAATAYLDTLTAVVFLLITAHRLPYLSIHKPHRRATLPGMPAPRRNTE